MPKLSTWQHHNPVRIDFGSIKNLSKYVNGEHVLLVTSSGFLARGVVDRLKDYLQPVNITLVDNIKPNPDWRDLDEIIEKNKNKNIDCIIGLGGGSVIDSAKILAATINNPSDKILKRYIESRGPIKCIQKLPLIAIPTTSGTGAEVTPFATIWDHKENRKFSISGDFIYPTVALLDVSLTLTLNEDNTLYPALDSISHALESLWNKNSTPISQAYATQSLSYAYQALPGLLENPKSFFYRERMQAASVLSGLAISQTKTAIAHSVSYPLTTAHLVPHGLACSFTLPKLINHSLTYLVAQGLDKKLLINVLNMLTELNLSSRLANYVSLEQLLSLQSLMLTPGRSDNFIFDFSGDIRELLISSFLNGKFKHYKE
jgi:alcohol dehydrogenase